MLTKLLQKVHLEQLTSLVSPAFFDVLPRSLLWREGRKLVANYRDRDGFEEVRASLDASLDDRAVTFGASGDDAPDDTYVHGVVTLYFHQLLHHDRCLLDLGPRALLAHDEGLAWKPRPMWTAWELPFLEAMRTVYRGFYDDEPATFRQGLDQLGLVEAEDLFRRHFGEDVSATRFELDSFIANFHDIFVFCRDRGITLPGGFLPLGVYLATMYENLDRFDGTVDARACFDRARAKSLARVA